MSGRHWKSIAAVVTDPFGGSQMSAQKAAAIAERCGGRLTLLNTFMLPQPVSTDAMSTGRKIINAATRERRKALDLLARQFRARGVQTRCIVRWDYPTHEAIIALVTEIRPDLLVSESHRHSRLGRLLLANTDWELMRDCPCPLWFVRSPELPPNPRVLVAVDPRHARAKPAQLDDRLLDTAQTLVHQLTGSVSVVHAYEAPLSAVPGLLTEPIRLPLSPRHARDFIAQTVQDVIALAQKHHVHAGECFLAEGRASNVIASVSKRCGADVLMMGAVSRSLPQRAVIGGTAEHTIDHVGCDVFIVKPAGFKARRSKRPIRTV
jgi:universal stress protein E